jgi:hypothetical protein
MTAEPMAASRTYDDVPEALWGLAKLSLRAHLHKLVAEKRVEMTGSIIRRIT